MNGPVPMGCWKRSSPWASCAAFEMIPAEKSARSASSGAHGCGKVMTNVRGSGAVNVDFGKIKAHCESGELSARSIEYSASADVKALPSWKVASRSVKVNV